ncbi:hypothetical protein KGF54_003618 [Candida jiufengensis]|uniref:uncharacterized protein n=1 Tax=Candida jiufengensis TaxID=497108 RepID=UPI0022258DEB|nr:uncharacterized protein KGF54_003618 [Candida jiufengensis]KAI5952751.1 hypothetical protein KGF54_003618 [Candida jiufengensis]
MTEDITFSDDPTIQELQSCCLIYENLEVDYENLSGSINIPIKIEQGKNLNLYQKDPKNEKLILLSTKEIHSLPPINLKFKLPNGYPHEVPPSITISSSSLSIDNATKLKSSLIQLWDDIKDTVIFNFIDHIQDIVQNSLDELLPSTIDVEDYEEFNTILKLDSKSKTDEFNSQTYTCEICQTENKGLVCTKFEECNHVFCNECLTGFFTSTIQEGDINKIHCPEYNCMKEYTKKRDELIKLESWMLNDKNLKDVVINLFTPNVPISQLKVLLSQQLIDKYLQLFKKSQFELLKKLLPNRLVECPRIGCEEIIFREDLNEKLVICKKCKYAFCNDCKNSYHARFKKCIKLQENEKYEGIPIEDLINYQFMPQGSHEKKILHAKFGRNKVLKAIDEYQMDKLFEQMLKEGTELKECPGCGAVIEKSDGCNRMKCSECRTCFCFNCGVQIDNTYDHFSDPTSPCYRLLFFGMAGVED